jgi:hypothetical protein
MKPNCRTESQLRLDQSAAGTTACSTHSTTFAVHESGDFGDHLIIHGPFWHAPLPIHYTSSAELAHMGS